MPDELQKTRACNLVINQYRTSFKVFRKALTYSSKNVLNLGNMGVRVVKWYEAGILSRRPGFNSCMSKPQKIEQASVMFKFARHSSRKKMFVISVKMNLNAAFPYYCQEIIAFENGNKKDPKVLCAFTETLYQMRERHANIVPTMAEAVMEVKSNYKEQGNVIYAPLKATTSYNLLDLFNVLYHCPVNFLFLF